jgi:lipopolysaccharide transport system ATP-binding protein
MSSEISVRVENLSKCYQIYDQPRDRLKQFIMPRLRRKLGQASRQYFREFWALKGVSFEVKRGETIGIIGRNGSGKSTILQMICGTLNPTSGSVQTYGRIAALLELGSGFNPEFTGRENIYMNGAVLGLSRNEIEQRFDDIVAFADIGDFLNQPVKTYSSGMYVRLAFSVIVHVDADILIVDEALAVGDMYFQAKCMAHMKRLMNSGVTVLFVSHDINSVKALCSRAVYLDHGNMVALGPTDEVVEAYYSAGVISAQSIEAQPEQGGAEFSGRFSGTELADQKDFETRAAFHRIRNGMAEFIDVRFLDLLGRKVEAVEFGQELILRMVFRANVDLLCLGAGYHIRNKNGVDVIYSDTGIERCHVTNVHAEEIVTMDWQFTVHLQHGDYSIAAMLSIPQDLSIGQVEVCDFAPLAVNFQVVLGKSLPIYGAAYWANKVSQNRHAVSRNG